MSKKTSDIIRNTSPNAVFTNKGFYVEQEVWGGRGKTSYLCLIKKIIKMEDGSVRYLVKPRSKAAKPFWTSKPEKTSFVRQFLRI